MMRPAITGGASAIPVIRSFGSEAGLKAARSSAAATRASTQGLYANGPSGRRAPGLGDNRQARVAFSPTSCRDACGAVGDRVRCDERSRRRASAFDLGGAEV